MKEKILSFWNTYKYQLISVLLLILSICINIFAIKSCSSYRSQNNNNIIALTDTIHYYKTKNGELVATKLLLEGDLSTLKIANDSLYNIVKDMNVKDPSSIIYIESIVEHPVKDTLWTTDTIIPNLNISKQFSFNDKYRSLEGNVFANDTTLGLNITKDQTYVDYLLAIEDNTVKLKSSNPYVTFNEITGITIPKQKHNTWGLTIGPAIYGGINPTNGKANWGIGVSLVYGLRIK